MPQESRNRRMDVTDGPAMDARDPFPLRKFLAPESVFGIGARRLAGQYARNLQGRRCLLVTDPGVAEAGWVAEVLAGLDEAGVDAVVYDEVSPNPRDHQVMRGAEVFAREGCDVIVAVGGGSPMDCAKGIGIVSTSGRHILEFEGVDRVEDPAPPLICVPTTAGSSADVSQFAIITDTERKVKIAIVSKTVVPDAALIDPETTTTMDAELTAATGMDALTHAMEAYASNANAPLTDLLALRAVTIIRTHLPDAIERPDDTLARGWMMQGSMLAGMAFSNAILGAVHAMAHSLGGYLDLPHGICNAILLPHVLAANFDAEPLRYAYAAEALGADVHGLDRGAAREALVNAVKALGRAVGITKTLKDFGVDESVLEELAAKAVADPCMVTNPTALSAEDVARIYAEAL